MNAPQVQPGEVLLRGHGITRRWGGLVAVNEVSLELWRGAVHAVIVTTNRCRSFNDRQG